METEDKNNNIEDAEVVEQNENEQNTSENENFDSEDVESVNENDFEEETSEEVIFDNENNEDGELDFDDTQNVFNDDYDHESNTQNDDIDANNEIGFVFVELIALISETIINFTIFKDLPDRIVSEFNFFTKKQEQRLAKLWSIVIKNNNLEKYLSPTTIAIVATASAVASGVKNAKKFRNEVQKNMEKKQASQVNQLKLFDNETETVVIPKKRGRPRKINI